MGSVDLNATAGIVKNYYKNQGKKASEIVSIAFLGQCLMSLFLGKPNYTIKSCLDVAGETSSATIVTPLLSHQKSSDVGDVKVVSIS